VKRVEALVFPTELEGIKDALSSAGVSGMTLSEARVFGGAHRRDVYRGFAHTVDFSSLVKIEIVASDSQVPAILDALKGSEVRRTGGEREVLIFPVLEVMRIRTGERGGEALSPRA
jgi:nitrogen regulatory protein P-II 1